MPGVNGLDVPMNLMLNFCRLTSLVCCVHDGFKLKRDGEDADLKKREKEFAVQDVPSVLDFWTYMYYCGACISGPWYEFKDYKNYMSS